MKKLVKNEDAFTGLEAAIVLIAFIVVAAVFSYVMLGAGFFATQEAQRTVHTGMSQATSNLEVAGPVTVGVASTGNNVGNVYFYLQLAAGGNPVDMSKVTYTVTTKDTQETFVDQDSEGTPQVTRTGVGQTDTDNMLESLEMMQITIPVKANAISIGVNEKFVIEVKPDKGAALPITRTAPPSMDDNKFYDVY